MKQTLIGHYLLHISFSSPPTCFFGTHFAGHYCIFYRSCALCASILLIYMLIWLATLTMNCKTAKRCLTP